MEERGWPSNILWWSKISEKSIEHAISQSETLLKETVQTGMSIRDRADKLFAILAPAIPALFVYILTGQNLAIDIMHLTAAAALLTMLLSFCVLLRNLKPYDINVAGDQAELFLNNELINNVDTEKEQFLRIALLICSNNKIRIESNELLNQKRSKRNQRAINILIIGLAASPLAALIVHLLYVHCFLPVPCR
jgi:hypothetical protein